MVEYLLTNLFNTLIAVVAMIGGYKLFDLITPRIDFYEEIKNKNYGLVAIIIVFFIGLCFVIASTTY